MNTNSIAIELSGLALACLEIYLPDFSEKLEQLIDKSGDRLKVFRQKMNQSDDKALDKWTNRVLAIILTPILIFIVFTVIRTLINSEPNEWLGWIIIIGGSFLVFAMFAYVGVSILVGIIAVFLYLIITLLEQIIRFLNAVTGGKAIGTIGLLLGLTGLIFELT